VVPGCWSTSRVRRCGPRTIADAPWAGGVVPARAGVFPSTPPPSPS